MGPEILYKLKYHKVFNLPEAQFKLKDTIPIESIMRWELCKINLYCAVTIQQEIKECFTSSLYTIIEENVPLQCIKRCILL